MPQVRSRSILTELDREYTLGEIAIITRAGPAGILGIANKGHLAPGADADITIYTPAGSPQAMFELPRMVIKASETILENGEIRRTPVGKTLHVAPTTIAIWTPIFASGSMRTMRCGMGITRLRMRSWPTTSRFLRRFDRHRGLPAS